MRRIAILGSTGSIGTSAVDIVLSHPQAFQVELLTAGTRGSDLADQVRKLRPAVAGVVAPDAYAALCGSLGVSTETGKWESTRLICGTDALTAAVRESKATIVLAAVVGMAGLEGVLAAIDAGKDVALANKESLVVAGDLVLERVKAKGTKLIPVDSEHSAIFQAMRGVSPSDLESVILTASGGPFLDVPKEVFPTITPEQALKHPKWNMGAKISIDSATMMNKALEVIEAKFLFGVESRSIEVVIHPQSIVHSLVRLKDGSLLAQLSVPDMRGPIAYALRYPDGRVPDVMRQLDLVSAGELTFRAVDVDKFPGITWAKECLDGARGASAVMNAANEAAVAAFLAKRVSFDRIFSLVRGAIDRFGDQGYDGVGDLRTLCDAVVTWVESKVDG